MADNKIISQLKNKINNGQFEIYNLGPELKYVGSLPLSGNNNLEEQLLLGGNKIIQSWEESNGTKVKIIEFRQESDNTNYYVLEEYQYNGTQGARIYILNKTAFLDKTLSSNFNYKTVTKRLAEKRYDSGISYDDNLKAIKFDLSIVDQKINLKYKNENGNLISVASKDIIETVKNNITTRREIVTNYL